MTADPRADIAISDAPDADYSQWRASVSAHRLGKSRDRAALACLRVRSADDGRHRSRNGVRDRRASDYARRDPAYAGHRVERRHRCRSRRGKRGSIDRRGEARRRSRQRRSRSTTTRSATLKRTSRANGVCDRVEVIEGDAAILLPLLAPVRVVLANIISSVLIPLLPVIRGSLACTRSGDSLWYPLRGTARDGRGSRSRRMDDRTRRHGGRLVERADSAAVATFFAPEGLVAGGTVTLSEEAAHHIRVARVAVGECVALRDGAGRAAVGTLVKISKSSALVDIGETSQIPRPAPVHLLAPVADRERMLWLAEKVTELGLTSWRPVVWRRSKSVSPRGEGPTFQGKVRGRMTSALIQSGGGWLPDIFPSRRSSGRLRPRRLAPGCSSQRMASR